MLMKINSKEFALRYILPCCFAVMIPVAFESKSHETLSVTKRLLILIYKNISVKDKNASIQVFCLVVKSV